MDRSLRAQWPELQASMPADMLPRPLPSPSGRARRKLVVDEYGCGAFGCVMPTDRAGVVVKITSDVSEAWFAQAAMALGRRDGWPPGIVQYYDSRPMNAQYRGRPLFLLWRQEAFDVGFLANSTQLFFGPLAKNLQEFKAHAGRVYRAVMKSRDPRRAAQALHATLNAQSSYLSEFVSEHTVYTGNGDRINTSAILEAAQHRRLGPAVHVKACEVIAEHMVNTYGQQTIGEALGYYLEHGLLLADVHAGNVGMATHENYARPIETITDPGLAVPINPAWFDAREAGVAPAV